MANDIHYLSFDPDALWQAMNLSYIEAGGDILYPGDEKEMLLRGVQSVVMQTLSSVDTALRMATLRYAAGEFLDIYGEKRNCARIQAQAATSTVQITFSASGIARTIATGTAMTADGVKLYLLTEDIEQTGEEQTVTAGIVCQDVGSAGNGLPAGTSMQLMIPNPAVLDIVTLVEASGGQNAENDETYRERIRAYGLASTTTGPQAQYESAAMGVSSEILDARALNLGAGVVGIYLLLSSNTGEAAILSSVSDALNAQNVRPLTDQVQVFRATPLHYQLDVQYKQEAGSNIASAVALAIAAYQQWQDETIGRAFNPDKLMAMLYQAGATRVVWGAESHFNNGAVAYTSIAEDSHCRGVIAATVMDEG